MSDSKEEQQQRKPYKDYNFFELLELSNILTVKALNGTIAKEELDEFMNVANDLTEASKRFEEMKKSGEMDNMIYDALEKSGDQRCIKDTKNG